MNKVTLTLLAIKLVEANGFSTHPLMNPARLSIRHHHCSHGKNAAAAFCMPSQSSTFAVASKFQKPPRTFFTSSPSSISASISPSEYDNTYFDDGDVDTKDIIDAEIVNTGIRTKKNKSMQERRDKKTMNTIQSIHPFIYKSWSKLKSKIQKPSHKALSLFTAAVIMLSVMFTPLSEAIAAPSGGRMGGSFGGSSRSSGRSSYSRSYSPPSRSSSSYNRGFRQGYNSGYYSNPSVIVAPPVSSYGFTSAPYSYGPGGVAVVRRGPSVFDIIVFAVFGMLIFSSVTSGPFLGGDDASTTTTSVLGSGVSVVQISVALNVPEKDAPGSILTYLNNLSRTAQTDSRVGVSNLVSQVALELLRQRRSIFAANTKYNHYKNADKAQRDFSDLAITERSKFDRESINKYGGVDYTQSTNNNPQLGNQFSPKATAAVVTIVLSIDGDSTKVPVINSVSDVQKALTQIASDVKVDNCLRSAEILWTPEDPNDTLSDQDVIVDYPELRTLF